MCALTLSPLLQFWIMYSMYLICFRNTIGSVWKNPPKSASTSEDSEPESIILADFNFFPGGLFTLYGYPYSWVFSRSIILEFLCRPCKFPLLFVTNLCVLYTNRALGSKKNYLSSIHKSKKVVGTMLRRSTKCKLCTYRAYIGCSRVGTEVGTYIFVGDRRSSSRTFLHIMYLIPGFGMVG